MASDANLSEDHSCATARRSAARGIHSLRTGVANSHFRCDAALQVEGCRHRRVVRRNILLPLDRVFSYGGKSACNVDVAGELRQSPAVVVPNGEELYGSEDLVYQLSAPFVDAGDALLWGNLRGKRRGEVEEPCSVPLVAAIESQRSDLAPWRTVEDQ